ncbi:MAG TPA: hypothetical protein VEK11_11785 [Thermoanaerobaculia bacterium]|jgi:hypothetical protein|nr:hypothetical protein [Thermoanaerobaculia bacterium]
MLKTLYVLLGFVIVGGYVYAAVSGMEFPRTRKSYVTGGIRGQHGSGNTYWYGGYRGGK